MRTDGQRTGISQRLDAVIIIAATLGVGGVVTAAVYNLMGSATSSPSISVGGASARAGDSAGGSPMAVSISVKNDGGSPISCTPATCQVAFAGTNTGSGAVPACDAPCSITSGGPAIWSVGGPAGVPAAGGPLVFETNTFTLLPGAQTSFVLDAPLSSVGTGATFWTAGASVTVRIDFGSASAQVALTSK
jgi:hypothetical protein